MGEREVLGRRWTAGEDARIEQQVNNPSTPLFVLARPLMDIFHI